MSKPVIKKEACKPLFDTKFIKVFDLQYEEGKHYFDATRRDLDDLVAIKSEEEFKSLRPDAVTCVVIINDKLLLTKEYRYPCGQMLLSPPAGLMDKDDLSVKDTAIREVKEETGIEIVEGDVIEIVNPCLFSSPGMTDESNALVLIDIKRDDLSFLNSDGAEENEIISDFIMLDKQEAREILVMGRDEEDFFYSAYTFCALSYFLLYSREI